MVILFIAMLKIIRLSAILAQMAIAANVNKIFGSTGV